MGRYDFGPQRVHKAVTRLLDTGRQATTPPWYSAVEIFPPSERLVRPALQSKGRRKGKGSRMFQPVKISYPEDKLREDFFGDHPWELARPRTILEDDGKDYQRQDWSRLEAPGRALNGESVVRRQVWLMQNEGLTKPEAYDKARKEFYKIREAQDIDRRIAKEEAQHMGAFFGKGAIEVGLELEDKEFEAWKQWAQADVTAMRQMQGSVYSGTDNEDAVAVAEDAENLLDDGEKLPESEDKRTGEKRNPLDELVPPRQP
ncbi:37S ribosomal protein S25-like protein [Elsinoe fawcettii]|nr:37S ribosomal protein S25-like protein [Elsinoe fawcettii]